MGPIQPIVSTLYFLKDMALLPHNFASFPCRRFDTNAGQCLPGDPVPYLCYPPEMTWTGLLAEAGVIGLSVLGDSVEAVRQDTAITHLDSRARICL